MDDKRKPGRPPAVGEPRTETIKVRATPAEFRQFATLGGADWLRRTLARAYARLVKKGGAAPPPSG